MSSARLGATQRRRKTPSAHIEDADPYIPPIAPKQATSRSPDTRKRQLERQRYRRHRQHYHKNPQRQQISFPIAQSPSVEDMAGISEAIYMDLEENRVVHDALTGDTSVIPLQSKYNSERKSSSRISNPSSNWSPLRAFAKEKTVGSSSPQHQQQRQHSNNHTSSTVDTSASSARPQDSLIMFSDPYDVGSVTTGISQQELLRKKARDSSKQRKKNASGRRNKKKIVLLPTHLLPSNNATKHHKKLPNYQPQLDTASSRSKPRTGEELLEHSTAETTCDSDVKSVGSEFSFPVLSRQAGAFPTPTKQPTIPEEDDPFVTPPSADDSPAVVSPDRAVRFQEDVGLIPSDEDRSTTREAPPLEQQPVSILKKSRRFHAKPSRRGIINSNKNEYSKPTFLDPEGQEVSPIHSEDEEETGHVGNVKSTSTQRGAALVNDSRESSASMPSFLETVAAIVIQTAYRRHLAKEFVGFLKEQMREEMQRTGSPGGLPEQRAVHGRPIPPTAAESSPPRTKTTSPKAMLQSPSSELGRPVKKPLTVRKHHQSVAPKKKTAIRIQSKNEAAIRIQSAFRGFWARDSLNVDHYCATLIQKWYLRHRERPSRTVQLRQIVRIQSIWRRALARDYAANILGATILIQAYTRGFLVRNRLYGRTSHLHYLSTATAAATLIQSHFRRYASERRYIGELVDIIIVQTVVRRWLARRDAHEIRRRADHSKIAAVLNQQNGIVPLTETPSVKNYWEMKRQSSR